MTIKNKLSFSLINLFTLIIGIICWILSLIILFTIIENFDSIALALLITFTGLAILSVSLGVRIFRTISIDTKSKTIKIKYLGLFGTSWKNDVVKGYKEFTRLRVFGTVHSIIIETTDGRQLGFTNFEIHDYQETKDLISTTYHSKEDIETNKWIVIKVTAFTMLITMTLVIAFGLLLG